jgi:hypothetical protein
MAASFEQRFGIAVPAFVLLVLLLFAIVLLVGAVLEQIGKWYRWIRSNDVRSRIAAISRSQAFKTAFSFRFLYRLAVLIWVVLISASVWRLGDDINRYALPRRLTEAQKDAIAKELKKTDPHDVRFRVADRDEEAASYRSDLQQALERGGWPVIESLNAPNLRSGLAVDFSRPPDPDKTSEERARERARGVRDVRPNDTLVRAFREAGVRIDSWGSGSGQNITMSTLTVTVGPRRRDRAGNQ